VSDAPLTAEQYREALALALAELENLPIDALEKAERLGKLQSYVRTVIGESYHGTEPIYGLRALRKGA
jgi:hypothetical protein